MRHLFYLGDIRHLRDEKKNTHTNTLTNTHRHSVNVMIGKLKIETQSDSHLFVFYLAIVFLPSKALSSPFLFTRLLTQPIIIVNASVLNGVISTLYEIWALFS